MRYFLSIFFALVITFSLPVFAKPASSKSAQEQEKQSGKGRYHEYQEEEQTKKKGNLPF